MDQLQTLHCFNAINVETEEEAVMARARSSPLVRLLASGCFASPLLLRRQRRGCSSASRSQLRCLCSHPTGSHGQDRLGVRQKDLSWFC